MTDIEKLRIEQQQLFVALLAEEEIYERLHQILMED